MKTQLMPMAGFLAFLTFLIYPLGHAAVNSAAAGSHGSGEAQTGASARISPETPSESAQQPGPWLATQQYFHSDSPAANGTSADCFPEVTPTCGRDALLAIYGFPANFAERNIHSLIVTVPDPLHTRMATETDRCLDAAQQAAFHSGFELATQWLPWTVKAESAAPADAKQTAAGALDVEKLPGLLVFRRHFEPHADIGQVLLLFVVGETPTAGVNGFEFQAARQTLALLGSDDPSTVAVAGPNFSGSLLSFTRLLESDPGNTHFEIHAGSVSNSDYARAMLLDLQSRNFSMDAHPTDRPSVTFYGTTLPTVSFRNHFVRLAKTFGLKPEQVAELVEDETGFSYTPAKLHADTDEYPIATFRYPRDIAQLRNAYNDAAFAPAAAAQEAGKTPALALSLKDTQSGEDIFPMFSSSHTPASQNAQLQQIVSVLNRQAVRLVSLSATNVFDTLFLASVLAQKCPDTRIVLRGADLLFVQEASQGSLSGLMAISPFPLFHEQTARSRAQRRQDVVTFATSDQIGEFNAVMSLLPGNQHSDRQQMATPSVDTLFSAAWVLVLGPSGWLPVDLYGQLNPRMAIKGQDPFWFDPGEAPRKYGQAWQPFVKAGQGWTALCLVCVVFSLWFCGRLFFLRMNPRKLVWSDLCLIDLAGANPKSSISDIVHSRYLCMMSCFGSLALANGLLLSPMLATHFRMGGPVAPWIELLVGVTFVVCVGTMLFLEVRVPLAVCRERPLGACPLGTKVSWWSLGLRVGILALSLGGCYVWWCCCNNGVPGSFLCYRTVLLAAPVCPIFPLLLGSGGLFALAYCHLRRFTWGDRRQPQLETSLFDQALCNEFQSLKDKLDRQLLRPFSRVALPGVPVLTVIVVLLALSFKIVFPAESLSSFEPHVFSRLLGVMLLLLGVLTLLSFIRFVSCWQILRAFLMTLNSVVLGRFFMRISDFGGNGPVWIREVKLMSLASAVNSAIALHNLENSCPACVFTQEYTNALRKFLSIGTVHGTRLDMINAYADFRRTAGAIMQALGDGVLRRYWSKNNLPFVGTNPAEGEETTATTDTAVVAGFAAAAAAGSRASMQVGGFVAESVHVETSSPRKEKGVGAPANNQPAAPEEAAPVSTEAYQYASKYVAMQYSVYIGYVLHQLQNLLFCCIVCFVLLVIALNSFSFQAPQAMFRFLLAAMVAAAAAVLLVLVQMERDPILSRLSGTKEGQLGSSFYWRILSYGALPVVTVLSTQFPAIGRFVSACLQAVGPAAH